MIEKTAYKHLENDEEFRVRLRARVGAVVMYSVEIEQDNFFGGTYKTREYHSAFVSELVGDKLDEAAWEAVHMQRRIVEVFP